MLSTKYSSSAPVIPDSDHIQTLETRSTKASNGLTLLVTIIPPHIDTFVGMTITPAMTVNNRDIVENSTLLGSQRHMSFHTVRKTATIPVCSYEWFPVSEVHDRVSHIANPQSSKMTINYAETSETTENHGSASQTTKRSLTISENCLGR